MKAHPELTVSELCRVLRLSSSCFYDVKTKTSGDAELRHRIKVIAHESGYTYGKRKLVLNDVSVGLNKVTRLMREMDIYVRCPKRKHY